MTKGEAKLVAFLLRWALGQEQGIDPSHALTGLAERVRAALGEGPDRYEVNALYAERRPQVVVREQPREPSQWQLDREREQREREQAEALAAFDPWRRFLGGLYVGETLSSRKPYVFARVGNALAAVSRWRQVSNTGVSRHDEDTGLAVRVAADTLAGQIDAAAADRQDPGTIAWVTAGLRCRRQPFCTGCEACQTVTSPHRELAGRPR